VLTGTVDGVDVATASEEPLTPLDKVNALAALETASAIAWLSQNVAHNPAVATELVARISDLRTGASRRGWKPF
jgi:hypothetical protein